MQAFLVSEIKIIRILESSHGIRDRIVVDLCGGQNIIIYCESIIDCHGVHDKIIELRNLYFNKQ